MAIENRQISYQEVLRKEFRPLAFYVENLFETPNDTEFFRLLTQYIVPSITLSSPYSPLVKRWIKEREAHEEKKIEAELKAGEELESTYAKLRSLLGIGKCKLLENAEISGTIASIESLLKVKSPLKNYLFFKNFSDQLKILLHKLLKLKKVFLVKRFAEIVHIKSNDTKTKEKIYHTNNFQILKFLFNPVLESLSKLQKVTDWKKVSEPWVAFDKLLIARWCWDTKHSFFTAKTQIKSWESGERSDVIRQFVQWRDMHPIKESIQEQDIKPSFFKRAHFIEYVKIIMNEILLYQEKHPVSDETSFKDISKDPSPYSLKLILKDRKLSMDVEWFKDSPIENIKLHKFKENSSPYDFIHFLLNQPLNSIMDAEPLGGTVPKYIDELNLKGILGELFIDRLSTYKAAAKPNPAYLKDFPCFDLYTLREQIKGLKKSRSTS